MAARRNSFSRYSSNAFLTVTGCLCCAALDDLWSFDSRVVPSDWFGLVNGDASSYPSSTIRIAADCFDTSKKSASFAISVSVTASFAKPVPCVSSRYRLSTFFLVAVLGIKILGAIVRACHSIRSVHRPFSTFFRICLSQRMPNSVLCSWTLLKLK